MDQLAFGKCHSLPERINTMSFSTVHYNPFFLLYLLLSSFRELRYKWIKHVFITVGEETMTSFSTSSFRGCSQTGEELRQPENRMTHQRTEFRCDCFISVFLESFLNHNTHENRDRESTCVWATFNYMHH